MVQRYMSVSVAIACVNNIFSDLLMHTALHDFNIMKLIVKLRKSTRSKKKKDSIKNDMLPRKLLLSKNIQGSCTFHFSVQKDGKKEKKWFTLFPLVPQVIYWAKKAKMYCVNLNGLFGTLFFEKYSFSGHKTKVITAIAKLQNFLFLK